MSDRLDRLRAECAAAQADVERLEAGLEALDERAIGQLVRVTCGGLGLFSILVAGTLMGAWPWPLHVGWWIGWVIIVLDVGGES